MLRVIRETRPLWVIGENVAGITNMVQPGSETDVETKGNQDEENYKETILEQEYIINTICDDIEREGYSVQPIIIPACGVGAPHKRYRVWFIASDCSDARVEGLRQGREDKIHGFEFTSQTMDKIRRLITDTSGLRSHRFLYDKEDDKKQSFMHFDTIHKIMKDMDGQYIVQLEGGEPTTHPQFYLLMEYISTLEKVEEIVIDTNALTLDRHIDKIAEIAVRNKKRITVKLSYNTYLKTVFSHKFVIKFANYLKNIISACEFISYVNFAINVRGYTDKELDTLKDELPQEMIDISSFHLFNSYGRAENDKSLPSLRINDVYDEWRCYASDGECFGRDLEKRAKHESKL